MIWHKPKKKTEDDEGGGRRLEADELSREPLGAVQLLLQFAKAEVRGSKDGSKQCAASVVSDSPHRQCTGSGWQGFGGDISALRVVQFEEGLHGLVCAAMHCFRVCSNFLRWRRGGRGQEAGAREGLPVDLPVCWGFLQAKHEEAVVRVAQVAVSRKARCNSSNINTTARSVDLVEGVLVIRGEKASVLVGGVAPHHLRMEWTTASGPELQLRGMQSGTAASRGEKGRREKTGLEQRDEAMRRAR